MVEDRTHLDLCPTFAAYIGECHQVSLVVQPTCAGRVIEVQVRVVNVIVL